MKLSAIQLNEISQYIINGLKYRETYYEICDHVISSLEPMEQEYHLDLVKNIIEEDFGSFSEITLNEINYEKEFSKNCYRILGTEMLNTFKWNNIHNNLIILALCVIFYMYSPRDDQHTKPMLYAVVIVSTTGLFAQLIKAFKDRKFMKPAMKSQFLGRISIFSIAFVQVLIVFIGKYPLFSLSPNIRLIILLTLFFIISVFTRAYLKMMGKTKILSF